MNRCVDATGDATDPYARITPRFPGHPDRIILLLKADTVSEALKSVAFGTITMTALSASVQPGVFSNIPGGGHLQGPAAIGAVVGTASVLNRFGGGDKGYVILALEGKNDEQAKEIISREHARYPGGEIKGQHQAPGIPTELKSLQQTRDTIFTNAKFHLLNQLGTTSFEKVDSRIRSIILPNVKVINSD